MVLGVSRAVVGASRVVSGGTVFSRTIATGSDDAEENAATGGMDLTSTNLDLGRSAADGQLLKVFLRFTNITLAAGSTVDNAHIQFATFSVQSSSFTMRIWGVDQDNQGTATTTTSFVTNLVKTTAFVDWTPATWATLDEQGNAQKSPNLKTIVDEIKARGGWASGNAMAFIIEWQSGSVTGVRESHSYNGNPELAPTLEINGEAPPAGEFDFSTLGSLVADYDGRAGITTAGTGVSQWNDQSGAGNHATQGTDAQRPTDGGDVAGFNAIDFTETTDDTLRTPIATTTTMTGFMVGQVGATPTGSANTPIASGAGSATTPGFNVRHRSDNAIFFMVCDGVTRVSTTTTALSLAAGANFIIGFRFNTTSAGIRLNGGSESTVGHSLASFGTNQINIASEGSTAAGTATTHWDGEITRVLVYGERLGDSNFATAFTELNGIYGIY